MMEGMGMILEGDVKIDHATETLEIYGVKYSMALFKFFGTSKPGEYFRLVAREDNGAVTVKRYITEEQAYKDANTNTP